MSKSLLNNQKTTTPIAKIFVGGFPVHLSEQHLWDYMSQLADVKAVKILKKNGKSRGFGFVTFESKADADHVISIPQHRISGKKFDCKHVVDEKQAKKQEKEQKGRKVFIGGLEKSTTEAELAKYFGRFGEIERAFLNKEHFTDKSRGSGFVLFKSRNSVELVLNSESSHVINGQAIECQPCLTRDEVKEKRKLARNNINRKNNQAEGNLTAKKPQNPTRPLRPKIKMRKLKSEAEERREHTQTESQRSSEENDFLHFFKESPNVFSKSSESQNQKKTEERKDDLEIFKLNKDKLRYGAISPGFREDLLNWRPEFMNGFRFEIEPNHCQDQREDEAKGLDQSGLSDFEQNHHENNLRFNLVGSDWKESCMPIWRPSFKASGSKPQRSRYGGRNSLEVGYTLF